MRYLSMIFLSMLVSISGICQKRNIPLNKLIELVSQERVSEVEKVVAKYKYTLSFVKKDTIDGKESQIYLFKKRSNRFEYHFTCSRVLNSTKGFIVSITTHDEKIFLAMKSEVEADKRNAYIEEELIDNCFRRKYQGEHDFLFSTCNFADDPLPGFIITVAAINTFIIPEELREK